MRVRGYRLRARRSEWWACAREQSSGVVGLSWRASARSLKGGARVRGKRLRPDEPAAVVAPLGRWSITGARNGRERSKQTRCSHQLRFALFADDNTVRARCHNDELLLRRQACVKVVTIEVAVLHDSGDGERVPIEQRDKIQRRPARHLCWDHGPRTTRRVATSNSPSNSCRRFSCARAHSCTAWGVAPRTHARGRECGYTGGTGSAVMSASGKLMRYQYGAGPVLAAGWPA